MGLGKSHSGGGGGGSGGRWSSQRAKIQQYRDGWSAMSQVDMGSNVNPLVREMNEMIDTAVDQFDWQLNENGKLGGEMFVYSFDKNGRLLPNLNGYQANTQDYQDMHINQSLNLHSVEMNRQGLLSFLEYMDKGPAKGYAEFAVQELANQSRNMRTALVRGPNGLTVMRQSDYRNNADFANDLRGNGYKVLKVWKGNMNDQQVNDWELTHRK